MSRKQAQDRNARNGLKRTRATPQPKLGPVGELSVVLLPVGVGPGSFGPVVVVVVDVPGEYGSLGVNTFISPPATESSA